MDDTATGRLHLTAKFVTAREQHHRRHSLTKAGWWSRLLIALLFAFYLNYVPIHLATAAHLDGLLESVAETVFHHHGHGDAGHSHDTDHHVPHPASDHNLNFTAQTQAPNALALAVFCVLADTSVLIEAPQHQQSIPILERIKPPGESPPGPLGPRAPPLA